MNKVPIKGFGPKQDVVPAVDPPPHETLRLRVEVHLLFDKVVDVNDFFHPDDYKGSEPWDDFITGSIAAEINDAYDSVDVYSVRGWMDNWNMMQDTEQDVSIEWEWVK